MRKISLVLALVLVITITLSALVFADEQMDNVKKSSYDPNTEYEPDYEALESKYKKIAINDVIGLGATPAELTSDASSYAVEKEWYEYIAYSKYPVGVLPINGKSDQRILFYDPYNYSEAMIMEVNNDVSAQQAGFSTANSIQTSYTRESSYSYSQSSEITKEMSVQEPAVDYSETKGEVNSTATNVNRSMGTVAGLSGGISSTMGSSVSNTFGISNTTGLSNTTGFQVEAGGGAAGALGIPKATVSNDTSISNDTTISNDITVGVETSISVSLGTSLEASMEVTNGFESAMSNSSERTKNIIAARITSATGVSNAYTKGWTSSESYTVTTTYEAAYFQENGNPYSWKVMAYDVKMPLKADIQYYVNGEWVTVDSDYFILTTLHGTCRSWIENSVVYFEHWGTGEKVTYNEFWKQFFTKESLQRAYETKLYPNN